MISVNPADVLVSPLRLLTVIKEYLPRRSPTPPTAPKRAFTSPL